MKIEIGKEYSVSYVDPLTARFKVLDIDGDDIKIEMWVNSNDIGWFSDDYYKKSDKKK